MAWGIGRWAWWQRVGLSLLLGLVLVTGAAARGPVESVSVRDLPVEARQVLALIQQGGPFAYRKDGVTFYNREGLLPGKARGYYSEYTVPTPGVRNRGARRIVAGKGDTGDPATSGEYWYTADHYSSFRRIRE